MLATEDTPGAHFFTYANPDEDSDTTRRDRHLQRNLDPSFRPEVRYISWARRIQQAYLSDPSPYLALAVPDDNRSIVRPATQKHEDDFILGSYLDNGATKKVVVRSHTDLIVLCPTDLGEVDWHRVEAACPPSIDLALEYDPSWPSSHSRPLPASDEPECARLLWLGASSCSYRKAPVWFIDYSLKRRRAPGGDYRVRDRREFWCARGRFVQVWDDDRDWDTGPEAGVHRLVAYLRKHRDMTDKKRRKAFPREPRVVPDNDEYRRIRDWVGLPPQAKIGVLAFEPW